MIATPKLGFWQKIASGRALFLKYKKESPAG
jgi:hypothetical protein